MTEKTYARGKHSRAIREWLEANGCPKPVAKVDGDDSDAILSDEEDSDEEEEDEEDEEDSDEED